MLTAFGGLTICQHHEAVRILPMTSYKTAWRSVEAVLSLLLLYDVIRSRPSWVMADNRRQVSCACTHLFSARSVHWFLEASSADCASQQTARDEVRNRLEKGETQDDKLVWEIQVHLANATAKSESTNEGVSPPFHQGCGVRTCLHVPPLPGKQSVRASSSPPAPERDRAHI